MTFIATAAAIVQTGARPIFVDIDPATGNMSVAALRRYLESPAGPPSATRSARSFPSILWFAGANR